MARPSDEALVAVTELLGVLSDPARLRIVLALTKGERNVMSLCEEFNMHQPTVSYHLGLLRMLGVVVGKRTGKQVIYSLADHIKTGGGKVRISLPPYTVTVAES